VDDGEIIILRCWLLGLIIAFHFWKVGACCVHGPSGIWSRLGIPGLVYIDQMVLVHSLHAGSCGCSWCGHVSREVLMSDRFGFLWPWMQASVNS